MRRQADGSAFLRPFGPHHLPGQLGYRPRNLRSLGRLGLRSGRPGRLSRLVNLLHRGRLGSGRLYAGRPHMGSKADAGFLRRPPGRRRRMRRRPGLGSRLWRSGFGWLRRLRWFRLNGGRRRSWLRRWAPLNELPGDLLNLWRRMRGWRLPSWSADMRSEADDAFRPRGLRPHHLPCHLNHGLRGRRWGGRPRAGDFPRDLPNWRAGRPAGGHGRPRRRLWRRRRRLLGRRWRRRRRRALHGWAGRRTALRLRRGRGRALGRLRLGVDGGAVFPPYLHAKRHVAI